MDIIWIALIGIVAGWLAGLITQRSGFGLIGDLIVGIAGAFIGGFLFHILGIAAVGLLGSLIMATVGAVLLILLLRLIKRS